MRRHASLAASILALAAALVPSAEAFDRPPISITGLTPDGWDQSTTEAEKLLRQRYSGITAVFCIGVTIPGYPATSSSFVRGTTRYWDKLVCVGYTHTTGNTSFGLIFDAKGQSGWIIYRLKGVTVTALETP